MKHLDASRQTCVFIGDSLTDISASRDAGMNCIAYASKPGKKELLASGNPQAIVTKISRIEHAVKQS
jgi:beta-phosphoglucomutase-like phosphatase (HAD superfamily)